MNKTLVKLSDLHYIITEDNDDSKILYSTTPEATQKHISLNEIERLLYGKILTGRIELSEEQLKFTCEGSVRRYYNTGVEVRQLPYKWIKHNEKWYEHFIDNYEDKLFTMDDMDSAYIQGRDDGMTGGNTVRQTLKFIDSLRPVTKWKVDIVDDKIVLL